MMFLTATAAFVSIALLCCTINAVRNSLARKYR